MAKELLAVDGRLQSCMDVAALRKAGEGSIAHMCAARVFSCALVFKSSTEPVFVICPWMGHAWAASAWEGMQLRCRQGYCGVHSIVLL